MVDSLDETRTDTDALAASAEGVVPGGLRVDDTLGAASAMDAALGRTRDDEMLTRGGVDALLSGMDMDAVIASTPEADSTPVAASAPSGKQTAEVSDALLAALLNAAENPSPDPPATGALGAENLAAAATAPQVGEEKPAPERPHFARKLVSDPVTAAAGLAHSAEASVEHAQISAMGTDGAPVHRVRRVWLTPERMYSPWLRANAARLAASVMAAALGGGITYAMLHASTERIPAVAELNAAHRLDLQSAMEKAREAAAKGDFHEAKHLLALVIRQPGDERLRVDAEYLLSKSRVETMDAPIGSAAWADLHDQIGRLVQAHPEHPMAPEARRWEAELYTRQDLPAAAYDVMKRAVRDYPDAPSRDEVLLETGKLALELNRIPEAGDYLQRILEEHPASRHIGEAELLLGEAYLRTGMPEDARQMFERVARDEPDALTRAKGVVKLGEMDMAEGRHASAEARFQEYIAEGAGLAGNDIVTMQLAKARRALGKLPEAKETLTQLVNFMPQSDVTPEAFVELVEVTDALGDRREAFQIAQQAATKFPRDPRVLRTKGLMLGLMGRPKSSAETLLAAHEEGAFDPEMLLTAARNLRTAGMFEDAERVYRKLGGEYSGLPAAIEGGIELARLHYDRGNIREAVEVLQALDVTAGTAPQHTEVLKAQADLYDQLGWMDELGSACKRLADAASEDEDLAQAALGLLKTGSATRARRIYGRLAQDQLREPTAHALKWALGEALLQSAPEEGLALMEEAYSGYPHLRNAQQSTQLLRAYLGAERPAAARRVVMDLAVAAKNDPTQQLPLLECAIAWGDFLYAKGDFRTAADAYAMAENAAKQLPARPSGPGLDPRWAQYQRANALLQLADYQGGLRLLDEIAATDVPWAREAEAKANFTRMEQRLSSAG